MLYGLQGRRWSRKTGNKARYLRLLAKHGYRVPNTFVLAWHAYDAFLKAGPQALQEVEKHIERHLDTGCAYAVRSSASVEDSARHSFAGQFATVLHVRGRQALLDAIQEVWASAQSASVESYAQQHGAGAQRVKMAVLLQEMVQPVFSGVAFTRNPVTGMDEVIVEAVRGEGAALVQEGASPWRWVWKWGKWLEQPSGAEVDDALAEEIVAGARSIAKRLKYPADLEWVYDDRALYWVQARPITALPEYDVYSNRISREFLPGIIKPLVWSVNVPLVNGAWVRLISELIGPNDLEPQTLSKAFHYRAYFNMGSMGAIFDSLGMRRETLELLMGLDGGEEKPSFRPSWRALRHLPRMARCAAGKLFFHHRAARLLPQLRHRFREQAAKPLEPLDEAGLLAEIDGLFTLCQQAAYANIVTPLLMQMYNGLFQRQLRRLHVDPDTFDVTQGLEELQEFDPKPALAALHRQFAALDQGARERIRAATYAEFLEMPGLEAFQQAVREFVGHFGHFSDSGNDFSHVPWREQPELVLQMATEFQETNPGTEKPTWETLKLTPFQRFRKGPLYRRARLFRFYREAAGFYYTLGYGQFRRLFRALGARLAARGVLEAGDDVFYLYWNEVRAASADTLSGPPARERVRQRKDEIAAVQGIVLPDIIFGDEPPAQEPASGKAARLQGIPTSRGYYRGPVCVMTQAADFHKMRPGAVAVIPYSDVSWTPVLVQAGAVVAESGGTLSHTSIIARESGIPAVVSVNNACTQLQDGLEVAVDGFKGETTVLNDLPQTC